MRIEYASNYVEMSRQGLAIMLECIKRKKDAVICLATGSTPKLMYEMFVEVVNTQALDISQVSFVLLDEWYKVEANAPFTCATFIKENLLDKLQMQVKSVISFDSSSDDVEAQLSKVNNFLDENHLDLMILGLGMNGHLGLNEPSDKLQLLSHQTFLNAVTKNHEMVKDYKVEGGLTIGFKGIFDAKEILMLVTGENKKEAYRAFMEAQITTYVPSTLLWLHSNCITIIDQEQFC